MTMKHLASYMSMSEEKIDIVCSLVKGNSTKECIDSLEARQHDLWDTCSSFQNHTYDFDRARTEQTITISVKGFANDCNADLEVQISKDKKEWETIEETTITGFPETDNILITGNYNFRYLRISDINKQCFLDWSFVSLGSEREGKIEAVSGVEYNLAPFKYNYFIVPSDFSTQASEFCSQISGCDSIALWSEDSWIKYYAEAGKEDFIITGGDEIGIYTLDYSKVTFGNATEGIE